MRNISVIFLNFGPVIQEVMSLKDISYLVLWQLFDSADLCNFCRGHYEEHFCNIFLNLNQWCRRSCRFKIFLI